MRTDKEILYDALSMWANYIETGSVILSAQDAKKCGPAKNIINALTSEQMSFIIKLRGLAAKALQGDVIIK